MTHPTEDALALLCREATWACGRGSASAAPRALPVTGAGGSVEEFREIRE